MLESNCERRVVYYGSRTQTQTVQRYSQIKQELLSLAYGTEKFNEYITEIDTTLETGHKPLLQILQNKPIDDFNPRL